MNAVFSPVFHWVLVSALLGVALVLLIVSLQRSIHRGYRRLKLGLLRVGALALLALILWQPQRRVDEVSVVKPQLAVLVDSSESMEDKVDPRQSVRAEKVREFFKSPELKAAAENFEMRFFRFDARLSEFRDEASELNFKGNGSNVLSSVQQLRERFVGQPLAAVLLLSDGLDSAAATAVSLAAGVPVNAFELEKPFEAAKKNKRCWISSLEPPGRLVVGWEAEVRASISASEMEGQSVAVELWKQGAKLGETTVTFNESEQTRPVVFPISASEPGLIEFEVRLVDPAADADSKSRPFAVEVVAPGKRILYVQNSFGFEFKFLRRAIIGDRNLQLQAYVRSGDGRLVALGERAGTNAGGAAPPKLDFSQAGLSKYSVVVLGDLPPETITPEQYTALREFVNRGGGLVLLGGGAGLPSAALAKTDLAGLSPVRLPAEYQEGRFPVRITDAGLRHPVFGPLFANVKEFPPLLTANFSTVSNPTTEVLLEVLANGAPRPVVAASRFGSGRVVTVLTDTVWHWRLGAKNWSAAKSPYDIFWSQLMEWLIPREQDKVGAAKLEVFTERTGYVLGEQPEVRAVLETGSPGMKLPASLPLSVRAPDGKVFDYTMKLGQFPGPGGKILNGYSVPVDPNVPGMFTAHSRWESGSLKVEGEGRFMVTQPLTERTGRPMDRDILRKIAVQTGGGFYELERWSEWPKDIHFKEQQIARVRLEDLWNHPLLLIVLLLLLSGDWVLRKRWNLP